MRPAAASYTKSKEVVKRYFGLAACGVSMVVIANAAEVWDIECNNSFEEVKGNVPSGWESNTVYPIRGTMRVITENVKEGANCIEVENADEAQFGLYVNAQQEVMPGDKIKLNIYVKGSGRFRLELLYYTGDDGHWWGHHPSEKGQNFDVDSAEWSLQERELTIPDIENNKGETISKIRPFIFISSRSTLQFDCFSGQIIRGE